MDRACRDAALLQLPHHAERERHDRRSRRCWCLSRWLLLLSVLLLLLLLLHRSRRVLLLPRRAWDVDVPIAIDMDFLLVR